MSELKNAQTSLSVFTLVSLPLRLLIYLSVAGAIVLPSYVSDDNFPQVNKSRQVEARNNIGAIDRAQQAYHLEYNRFADSMKELGLRISTETSNYRYRIVQPMMPVQDLDRSVNSDSDVLIRIAIAQGKNFHLKNYLGVVYTVPDTSASGEPEIITRAILCERTKEKPLPTTMPTLVNGEIQCDHAYVSIGE